MIKFLTEPFWNIAGGAMSGGPRPDTGAPPAEPAATPPAAAPEPDTDAPEREAAPDVEDRAADEAPDTGDSDSEDFLGSGSDDDRKVVVNADWPEDWSEKMSGGNEKLQKALARYSDPTKVAEALLAAQQKISSGEYKKAIDENSSDEEKAAARAEVGIPDDWSGYEIPDDLEAVEFEGGTDDPMLQSFLTEMHGAEASNKVVGQALRAFDKITKQAETQRVEEDREYKIENEDRLRAQWGDDFRSRVNVYLDVLKRDDSPLPSGVRQALEGARDGNGRLFIQNAAVADWLQNIGVSEWGEGSLVSGGERKAQSSRLDEIRKTLKEDPNTYWGDKNMQKEFQDLLEQQERRR